MLAVPFCDIFSTDEFNYKLNVRYTDRVHALNWILHSTVPPARRIISQLASKAQGDKEPVVNSTINSKKDVVLNDLDTGQVSQTFRAALSVHTFVIRDDCIRNSFRITFYGRKCSIIQRGKLRPARLWYHGKDFTPKP